MSKILIAYYSFTGNTKLIADNIAKIKKAKKVRIKPEKDIKDKKVLNIIKGAFQVVFKQKPDLDMAKIELKDFDVIFIGTPVWAGSLTPAVRTFLSENNFAKKKVVLFSTYEGAPGKTFKDIEKILENIKIIDSRPFQFPIGNDKKLEIEIKDWLRGLKI